MSSKSGDFLDSCRFLRKKRGKEVLMKKIVACLLSICILGAGLLVFHPQTANAASSYSTIRVKLTIGEPTSVTFTVDGEYSLVQNSRVDILRGSTTVAISGSNMKITNNGITTVVPGNTITLKQHAISAAGNNVITLYHPGTNHKATLSYLGDMQFKNRGGGIEVVNILPLEQYLYGVVPHEMGNSYNLEALKAQAVAARSYALSKFTKDPQPNWEVNDTPTYQIYKGYNPGNARAIQAVNETMGMVGSYQGERIAMHYSASNGGQTELASNGFNGSSNPPYYVMKDDPYDLASPINKRSLEDLLYVPKNAGSSMDASVRAEMQRLVYEALKSNSTYNLSSSSSVTIKQVTAMSNKDPMYPTKGTKSFNSISATVVANVPLRAGGTKDVTQTITIKLNKEDTKLVYKYTPSSTWLRMRGVEEASGGWNIYFRRWGHGVGMSQNGAQQMADRGNKFRTIINYYYKNVDIDTYDTSFDTVTRRPAYNNTYTVTVVTDNLNVRAGATTNSASLGKVSTGQTFTVSHPYINMDFHQITYNGQIAYISTSSSYTRLNTTVPGSQQVTSSVYRVEQSKSRITNVSPGTSISTLLAGLSGDGTMRMVDASGNRLSSGTVGTGMRVQLFNSSGTKTDDLSVVIYGDLNGDGNINSADILLMQKHLLKTKVLSGAYLTAGNITKKSTDSCTSTDIFRLQRHLLKISTIQQ